MMTGKMKSLLMGTAAGMAAGAAIGWAATAACRPPLEKKVCTGIRAVTRCARKWIRILGA